MSEFRLLPPEEVRAISLSSGYEDGEDGTAEEKFLNELETTMVELQVKAYKAQQEAISLAHAAYQTTQMAYSIFEKEKIMEILNSICDQTDATPDHRESFLKQAEDMLNERDSMIMNRFGKLDGPIL